MKPGRWVAAVSWIAVACAGGAPVVPPPQPSVTRLTVSGARNGQPLFSPDGGRILFATDRFGGVELAYLAVAETLSARCVRGALPR